MRLLDQPGAPGHPSHRTVTCMPACTKTRRLISLPPSPSHRHTRQTHARIHIYTPTVLSSAHPLSSAQRAQRGCTAMSAFQAAQAHLAGVKSDDGFIATVAFLDTCRQVLPVVGA